MAIRRFSNRGFVPPYKLNYTPAVPVGSVAPAAVIIMGHGVPQIARPPVSGRRKLFGRVMSLSDYSTGLGADIFTQMGKSLKGGLINWVAPSVSKVTGVNVTKVRADLAKIKTKVKPATVLEKIIRKRKRTALPAPTEQVNPIVEVPQEQAPDISDGTPMLQRTYSVGSVAIPAYVPMIIGGVVVIGVVYLVMKK